MFKLTRLAPLTLLLPLLAGCGPDRNVFAPACPTPGFVKPLADLTRYRPGGGQDYLDLVMTAKMLGINGSCVPGDTKEKLNVTVTVTLDAERGPAMQGGEGDLLVFIAATDAEAIRDKQVYPVHVRFPPNVPTVRVVSPPIDMTFPVNASKSGAAYGIIAGFQLTPEEMAANRHRLGQ